MSPRNAAEREWAGKILGCEVSLDQPFDPLAYMAGAEVTECTKPAARQSHWPLLSAVPPLGLRDGMDPTECLSAALHKVTPELGAPWLTIHSSPSIQFPRPADTVQLTTLLMVVGAAENAAVRWECTDANDTGITALPTL